MRSRSRKRATTTKKKNPNNGLKKEAAVLVISSSSEEPNEEEENEEEEEEVKSSNSSNQNMNEESMEEEEEEEEEEVVEEEAENVKRKGKKIIPSGNATCRFPANSIKRIIKNEGIVFRSTQEAIFLINKATEKFLEKFCENAYSNVVKDRKKAVHYKHISSIVSKRKRYDFLSDCVPEKVKAGDALSESKSAET